MSITNPMVITTLDILSSTISLVFPPEYIVKSSNSSVAGFIVIISDTFVLYKSVSLNVIPYSLVFNGNAAQYALLLISTCFHVPASVF